LVAEMDALKKQFIRIRKEDVENVKTLFNACGVMYCEAPGEADQLCARMVINKQAWACMSDDMDMFVYGCPRVLRHISLLNHTVIYYNTTGILRELKIHMKHFREIMVLSGTDYNNRQKTDLRTMMDYYQQFAEAPPVHEDICENLDTPAAEQPVFHAWLRENTNYNMDDEAFDRIYNMFYISDTTPVQPKRPTHNIASMKTILKPYGFIFV
jgi:5'-3' exonuclease